MAGSIGCTLKKGHKGPHANWIYSWRRKTGDARRTAVRLARERREARNEAARAKRAEIRWKRYQAQFEYIPADY